MKKIILFALLIVTSIQTGLAQDLNTLVSDFSESENALYQAIDKETLNSSLEAAKASDSTGTIASQIPPFMQKIDMIEVLDLTQCSQEVKEKFTERFNSIEDGDGFETLVSANDESDRARIMAKKDGTIISEILILAINNEKGEIAIVKMTGKLDDSDMDDIIKKGIK